MKRNELKRKLGMTAAASVLCLGLLGVGTAAAQEAETEAVSMEAAGEAETVSETEALESEAAAEPDGEEEVSDGSGRGIE